MKKPSPKARSLRFPVDFPAATNRRDPASSSRHSSAILQIKEQMNELLKNRDGLMCGICNGFQALIKLGLVPFGEIIDTDSSCPTLTFNTIGRHQSMLVRTRVASNKSPWLMHSKVGDIHTVAISHGEGRFVADEALVQKLAQNGQIATPVCRFRRQSHFEYPL